VQDDRILAMKRLTPCSAPGSDPTPPRVSSAWPTTIVDLIVGANPALLALDVATATPAAHRR
jgi:hypothetical protein